MIIKADICVCCLCKKRWLPENPGIPDRCSSCKSRQWNADDPKVIAKKATPATVTEAQKAKAVKHTAVTLRSKMLKKRQEHKESHAGDAVPYLTGTKTSIGTPRVLTLCAHRVLKHECPICRKQK